MTRRTSQTSQAKQNSSTDHNSPKLTFLEHLRELRKRIFWVVLVLVLMTVVGLEIKDWLIEIVVAPLRGQQLIYLTPGGGFNFIFTLSLYFGALLTIPVGVLQLFKFLQPLLPQTSRKFMTILIGTSTLLAAAGAALAYFLAIPAALGFLDGFTGNSIVPSLTAESYLNFVVVYIVGLALLFQLPLLLFLYDHIRPIPPGSLARSQRYGIVAATILAALVTPSPDLTSYAIVLIPILGVYEFGVLIVFLRRKLLRERVVKQRVVADEVFTIEAELPEFEHEPALEPVVAEPIAEPLTAIVIETAREEELQEPVATREAIEPVVMPSQQVQEAPMQQAMVAQKAAIVPPVSINAKAGRSIDGMRIAHKTDVQLQAKPVQPKIVRKSIDGVLTAPA